jgi:hypothetical protein
MAIEGQLCAQSKNSVGVRTTNVAVYTETGIGLWRDSPGFDVLTGKWD